MPAPPFHASLRAGPVAVRVGWDAAALTAPLRETLSYFGSAEQAPAAPDLHVQLCLHAPPLHVPAGAEPIGPPSDGLRFSRLGDALFIHYGGTVARVEAGRGRARITFSAEAVEGRPFRDALIYSFFLHSLVVLLAARGYYTMHAACLVWQGEGCLFAGQSDSGKSTLALRLAEQGWHYLTDDSLLLGMAGGAVEAHALRRDFCVDPDAEELFPHVAAYWQPHVGDARKQRLRVRECYPGGALTSCPPRHLFLPRLTPGRESQVVEIGPREALVALMPHTSALTLLDAARAAHHLETLRTLVEQARCYTLLAGSDLRDQPGAADALLTPLLARARPC